MLEGSTRLEVADQHLKILELEWCQRTVIQMLAQYTNVEHHKTRQQSSVQLWDVQAAVMEVWGILAYYFHKCSYFPSRSSEARCAAVAAKTFLEDMDMLLQLLWPTEQL